MDVHITPDIKSYGLFGSEYWAGIHPVVAAADEMLYGSPESGIEFPTSVCEDCKILAPVSLILVAQSLTTLDERMFSNHRSLTFTLLQGFGWVENCVVSRGGETYNFAEPEVGVPVPQVPPQRPQPLCPNLRPGLHGHPSHRRQPPPLCSPRRRSAPRRIHQRQVISHAQAGILSPNSLSPNSLSPNSLRIPPSDTGPFPSDIRPFHPLP